jgi:membrane associated rhomboid family serine protease
MPPFGDTPSALPQFRGIVRKLVIFDSVLFFVVIILQRAAPAIAIPLLSHLVLQPAAVAHGEIWQLVTYSFFHFGVLEIVFAMFSLWVCGSMLETAYGNRFVREVFFTSVIGGAIVASLISYTHVFTLSPTPMPPGTAAWAGIFGLLLAIGSRFGEQEFLFFFLIRMKAKYMVALYLLISIAFFIKNEDAFGALLQLSGALCGYLYVRYAPGRGLAFGVSERIFGLRNAYYRNKRRRAARKFEVYMGKQGRKVNFDKEGRYIDPDSTKDPNDKRWMN